MSNIDFKIVSELDKNKRPVTKVSVRRPSLTQFGDESWDVKDAKEAGYVQSAYTPTEEERNVLAMVRRHFTESDVVMRRPRREFNDLSVLSRLMVDQMSFNSYQPNNGDPTIGDAINSWKSNAMRPVVRNKCISIAAHVCAKTIFPKIFAWNKQSEIQSEAAMVMNDLYQYAGNQMNYPWFSLEMTLTSLWSPAAIAEIKYGEVVRTIKGSRGADGKYETSQILDEDFSGFQGDPIGADELYIADFYVHDIQKQPYLIKRKVMFWETAKEIYGHLDNFKYVKPGIQVLYNDANQTFYEVYDSVMRQNLVEEITYYNRRQDLKLTILNGVLVSAPDEANPRIDKRYPFVKFGFELLDEGKCFYFKSLVFKIAQDASIINTLYPMIVDGTYLNLMPPLLNTTGERIPSSVNVPGAITTISQPSAGKIEPLIVGQNLPVAFQTLQMIENSVSESAPQMTFGSRRPTAFELSVREQEANILLGLFTASVGSFVWQLGKLLMSDIPQHLTIGEVMGIEDDSKLVYKTFVVENKDKTNKKKHKRIVFDNSLPDTPITEKEKMQLSYKVLEEERKAGSDTSIIRVNPSLFRELHYELVVSPDTLNPMSEATEQAFRLEIYDRGIKNPAVDQDELTKEFLFGAFPESARNPDKFIKKQSAQMPPNPFAGTPQGNPPASPLNAMKGMGAIPPNMPVGTKNG
ncbi:hypothetical protein M1506_00305 [Patescibacteria group bacterium]|nr:hypothetical protein [Patescibacteria group bacterium]